MWKKLMILGPLLTALSAGPALASPSTSDGAQLLPSPEQQTNADQDVSRNLAGMDAWSSDGERLGEVTTVNLDDGGSVRSIYVEMGAFLGLGSKTVEVAAAQYRQYNGRVILDMNADAASDLPEVASE